MFMINDTYLKMLSGKLFNGEPLRKLTGSLYQAGRDKVILTASAPSTEAYVFGVNANHLAVARCVVLGCVNHDCAFRIPADEFRKRPFSVDKATGRKITAVGRDRDGWYLTCKKQAGGEDARLAIDSFKYELIDDGAIVAMALGVREAIGLGGK